MVVSRSWRNAKYLKDPKYLTDKKIIATHTAPHYLKYNAIKTKVEVGMKFI